MRDRAYFLCFTIGFAIIVTGIVLLIYFIIKPSSNEEEEKLPPWESYNGFVLSLYWPASFCSSLSSQDLISKCFNKIKNLNDENFFTIHSLTPVELTTGEVFNNCNLDDKKINPEINNENDKNILKVFWPSLNGKADSDFWKDEYNSHGYCYMKRNGKKPEKDYLDYFNKVIEIYNNNNNKGLNNFRNIMENLFPDTETGFHKMSQTRIKEEIESVLHQNSLGYQFICTNNKNNKNILTEIQIYLDMNFNIVTPAKFMELNNNNENILCPETFELNFVNDTKIPVYEKYDYNVFSLIWNPTSCMERGKNCYEKVLANELNIFMIHGLWPSFKTGIFPQWCNMGPDIEIINQEQSDIFYDLHKYWIGTYTNDEDFWIHEYNKHGYCHSQRFGIDVNDYLPYFEKCLKIYKDYKIKDLIKNLYPGGFIEGIRKLNRTYLDNKLDSVFGENTHTLVCFNISGKPFLIEIRLKMDVEAENIINEGITNNNCPEIFYLEIIDSLVPRQQDYGIIDNYNMYMLAIQVQSTACKTKGYQCYDLIKEKPLNYWNVHGLWPNYKNSTIPNWCNGKNDIFIDYIKISNYNKSLAEYMDNYWPSSYHTNYYFWGNEYNKHGYCFNKRMNYDINEYEKYFGFTVDLFEKYDFKNMFYDIYGKEKINNEFKGKDIEIKRELIQNYFEKKGFEIGTYLLVCTDIFSRDEEDEIISRPFISEIRIRLDLDFTPFKNITDKSEYDCPETFYAEFL